MKLSSDFASRANEMNELYTAFRYFMTQFMRSRELDPIILEALQNMNKGYTKQRMRSWRLKDDDEDFKRMTKDELKDVFIGLAEHFKREQDAK